MQRTPHLALNWSPADDIVVVNAKGCEMFDANGRRYLDFMAGIGVVNTGHCHPQVVQAIEKQARSLLHSQSYIALHPPILELAEKLAKLAPGDIDSFFFCNSGSEAVEAGLRLARSATGRANIIAFQGGFHGRTAGAMSLTTSNALYRSGALPAMPGVFFAPFPRAFRHQISEAESSRRCLQALREMLKTQTLPQHTAAMVIEPVQGEGGVCRPDPEYLKAVRHLCDKTGTLLIFDEIQTGIGRTGKLFAYQHFGIEPDIMTLAKALANGLPIGAMLAREHIAEAFGYGAHASTFGGGPVITVAALAVLKLIEEEKIVNRCFEIGNYFFRRLEELKAKYDIVEQVRGLGLLLGLKLKVQGAPIVTACMENGFLINCVQNNILRFIPPLIIKKKEIDDLIRCLDKILSDI